MILGVTVASESEVDGVHADKLHVFKAWRIELMCCDVEMSETNKTNSEMRNFKTVKWQPLHHLPY